MKASKHSLFLLGGYDLEMLTIKQMLEGKAGCIILDKHLQWDNARLSSYQDELCRFASYDIYGIELQEDIPLPRNYHRIDHHNDWADKPSSLEQVAEIFGETLSPDQQLVAANDKGYIPAMQALGATNEEIDDIRRKDRAAQGVTENDERMAELSISKHFTNYNGLYVVHAQTSRFSPICDRLYPYQCLLIYTDSKWAYYGKGKSELVAVLADDINNNKVYHGGGDNGYIGATWRAFSTEKIFEFVTSLKLKYEHN